MYDIVKSKLSTHTAFRERRTRHKGLVILALRAEGLDEKFEKKTPLDENELADFARTYESLERVWRDVLKNEESLRGLDYHDKVELEQEKEIFLGYEVGYHKDVKELKKI